MKFLLSIMLIVLTFLSVLAEKKLVKPKLRIVFLAIRAGIVLLFLTTLFRINLFSNIFKPASRSIVLVIEASKSMTLRDGESKSRWQKAADALASIKADKRISRYYFNDDGLKRIDGKIPKKFSDATNLNQLIKNALTMNPRAIVLFSDGNHNVLDNPVTLAAGIVIPVHTIGIGPIKDEVTGLLKRIKHPDEVAMGENIELQVETGNIREKSEIIIHEENGRLLSRTNCHSEKNIINFEFKPLSAGLQRYSVKLVSGMDTTDHRDFVVNVKNDVINILYLSNNPGWEVKFMSQEFIADRGFEFIPYLWKSLKWETENQEKIKGNIQNHLNLADVIILHNIKDDCLDISLEHEIIEQVQNKGKGLLILGLGWLWDFRDRPLYLAAPILPSSNQSSYEGRMVFTNHVGTAGIFRKSEYENIKALIAKSPPLQMCGKPKPVKNNAVIIGNLKTQKEEAPFWAWQFINQGRAMQMSSEYLWPWKISSYGILGDSVLYSTVLISSFRWLAGKAGKEFKLSTDRNFYYANDKVKFQGEINTPNAMGPERPSWTVHIKNKLGWSMRRKMVELTPGRFISEAGELPIGEYSYQSSVDMGGRTAAKMSGKFWVDPAPYQEKERTQNRDVLKEISRVSRGNYWDIDSLAKDDQWLKKINTAAVKSEHNSSSWFPLFLILVLLLIEWLWRRYLGLN